MSGVTFLYGLFCPESGQIRYIGKANDVEKRLKTHIRDARRRNRPVCQWVSKLCASGVAPVVKVLFSTWSWAEAEKQIIQQYRADGADLLNLADGGAHIPTTRSGCIAAAQGAAKARPPAVMMVYRRLEHEIRLAAKVGNVRLAQKCLYAKERFAQLVAMHRAKGTLPALDARVAHLTGLAND